LILELWRILKKNGILTIKASHFSSVNAFDVFHKRFFRFHDFETLNKESRTSSLERKRLSLFKIKKIRITFEKRFPFWYNYIIEFLVNLTNLTKTIYENTLLRNIFPAKELVFIGVKN